MMRSRDLWSDENLWFENEFDTINAEIVLFKLAW